MSVARAISGVVIPIYLVTLGYSAVELGLVFAVVGVTSALMSTLIGFLSDRVGNRIFLIVIPILTALAGAAYVVSDTAVVMVSAAALGSLGRGGGAGGGNVGPYMPAEQSLVASSVSNSKRNQAFGRLAFVSTLGSLIGGLLTELLVKGHPGARVAINAYRGSFEVVSLTALLAGLAALWILDPPPPSKGPRKTMRFFPKESASLVYRLWVTNSLNGAAIGMFGPFITYWFYTRYGATPGSIGVLFAVVNAASLISNLSAAPIAKKIGLVRSASGMRVLVALLLVPMVLAPSFLWAALFFLLRMMGQRVVLPLRQSYVMAMANPQERARVAALSNLPAQGLSAATPTLAGELFDHVSLAAPFLVSSVLQLANAITFFVFFHNRSPQEEEEEGLAPVEIAEE